MMSTVEGVCVVLVVVFFQAEDGIRDLVRSRGLGDVYKRQLLDTVSSAHPGDRRGFWIHHRRKRARVLCRSVTCCLLYTSDAADERSSVDLGGRRIIKKKNARELVCCDDRDDKTIDRPLHIDAHTKTLEHKLCS